MKPINIRFKLVTLFLITTTVLLTTCKKKTETVFVTPNISVELPFNYQKFVGHDSSYVITNPSVKFGHKSYKYVAKINNNDIFIGNMITKEFDTLNLEEKIERIKNHSIRSYVRGFNGRNLVHDEKIINGLAQSEFNFEFDLKDKSFIVYSRLIIQDTNFLILNYKTMMPVSNISIRDKDKFFKSIKYN